MNCLADWIGPLTEKALDHVTKHRIEDASLPLGRKGRVTYEDDGSNLRASVVEADQYVQILQWDELDDSRTEALLSDSYAKVRSIFSGKETSAFKRKHGIPVTKETKGGLLVLNKFQIVVSRTVKPQISLYIEHFELVGCEGTAVFGNPRDIHSRRNIMPLMDHFAESDTTQVRQHESTEAPSGHDQCPSSPGSEVQSQAGASPPRYDEPTPTDGVLDSQEGISTQAPPLRSMSPHSFQPKVDAKGILENLKSWPNDRPTKNTGLSIQNQTHSPNTKGNRQLPNSTAHPHHGSTPRRISASSSEKQSVVRGELRPTTISRNTATVDKGLRPNPLTTPSNSKRKNRGSFSSRGGDLSTEITTKQSGTQLPTPTSNPKTSTDNSNRTSPGPWKWKKRIKLRDVRIPKNQEELLDSDDSWVPPESGGPVPHRYVPSTLLQEWDDYHPGRQPETQQTPVTAQPERSADNNDQPKGSTPWRRTKIRLRDVNIPKDQQKLIDSESSWVPPPTGDRMPRGHVPIHLLQQWNDSYRQKNEEPLREPSLPTRNTVSEVNGNVEYALPASSQSSEVPWSESPERNVSRPELPPDSSSPEKQQQPAQDKENSMGALNNSSESPVRNPMQLHNASGQIRQSSWDGGDDAQPAPSNALPDRSEDESDDCEMDTSIPIPLEYQTQSQDLANTEEITSSGPSLPASISKQEPFTQVSQSPAMVSFGSHRKGCSGISSQCQCPLKNPSSSAKLSSDPRVPATCYTTVGGIPCPASRVSSQAVPPSVQVFETPLNPNNSVPKLLADQASQLSELRSKTQSPKRNREDALAPFETPSKRHKSVDILRFDDAPKSPEELLDALADRRQTYIDQKSTSRNTQDIFNKFKQTYPDYNGNMKHFTSMCRKLQAHRNQGKLERSFLWDDFIIHQATDYREYIAMCVDAAEDPERYEEYFQRNFATQSFKKRSLTHRDLQTVLAECGDPAAADVRTTSATPFSVSSQSHISANGTGPNSSVGTPNPALPTLIAKDAEEDREEKPLEIEETQPEVPRPTMEAAESGSDGDDEDGEEVPQHQAFQNTHDGDDDDDDREIPCTPVEDLHETASVELGDYHEDSEPLGGTQKASPREREETFSNHDLEFEDESDAPTETPKGPRVRGDSAAIPIEIGSSLESNVNKGNDVPQESLDLDDILGIKKDVEKLLADDESYHDENEDDDGEESDESYHDIEEENQEQNDDANASVLHDHERDNDRVSHPRFSRSRRPSPSLPQRAVKKHNTTHRQVLIPSPSPDHPPSPAKPASPKKPPQWHELPNTPYKFFAQAYANLRSELGDQSATHWTREKGAPERKRKPIPVDEKGVIRPPRQNEGKVFKRGQIGWSFK